MDMIAPADLRVILPTIRVPTLVMHQTDDRYIPAELGREVALLIPGARFIEYPGGDTYNWVEAPGLDEVEKFLTGRRREEPSDRVLATVLFTDIVGSTEHASRLGEGRWRSCWASTTASCASSLSAGAAPRSRRSETDSSPPSTARQGRFRARRRS